MELKLTEVGVVSVVMCMRSLVTFMLLLPVLPSVFMFIWFVLCWGGILPSAVWSSTDFPGVHMARSGAFDYKLWVFA